MFLPAKSPEQPLQLAEFDQQAALEALCQGQTVIPFLGDSEALLQAICVHQQLRDNLKSFNNSRLGVCPMKDFATKRDNIGAGRFGHVTYPMTWRNDLGSSIPSTWLS